MKVRTNSILSRLGNHGTNKLQVLRKRMTMEANRNSSYSPEKANRFINNTTTTGFNLTLRKSKKLGGLGQDRTPLGGSNTPLDRGF
jgi:hypothetical protein